MSENSLRASGKNRFPRTSLLFCFSPHQTALSYPRACFSESSSFDTVFIYTKATDARESSSYMLGVLLHFFTNAVVTITCPPLIPPCIPVCCLALDRMALLATLLWKQFVFPSATETQTDRRSRALRQNPLQSTSILCQLLFV